MSFSHSLAAHRGPVRALVSHDRKRNNGLSAVLARAMRMDPEHTALLLMVAFAAALLGVPIAHAQVVDSAVVRQAGFSPERLDRLRAMLESEVDAGRLGSGVGLVSRDGRIVYLGTVGVAAPNVPMFADAIMRLASVGKGFTAVAALILYERGELDLDDPVAQYIPAFRESRVALVDADGDTTLVAPAEPVAIRHLLTHTGGLNLSSDGFEQAWMATQARTTTLDLAERIACLPMPAHPGEAFEYGYYGSSYEVLAAVIEVVSGETLEAFFGENLFRPLGMTDSHFWVPEEKLEQRPADRRAGSWRQDPANPLHVRWGVASARSVRTSSGLGRC